VRGDVRGRVEVVIVVLDAVVGAVVGLDVVHYTRWVIILWAVHYLAWHSVASEHVDCGCGRVCVHGCFVAPIFLRRACTTQRFSGKPIEAVQFE